jgi:putative membrane protein
VKLLVRVVIHALALAAATYVLDGITLTGDTGGQRAVAMLVVAVVFGLVNAVVRPVVTILSIPFIIVTFGLLLLVINGLMLLLTSWLSQQIGLGFHVDGLWTAVVGAVIVSVTTWLLELLLPSDPR